MVHGMDALSKSWRDDPVRAALEKKKNREMAAAVREDGARRANELLKRKLATAGRTLDALDNEVDGAVEDDAAYKRELEKQRKRLMDEGAESDSSGSSVFDPFLSR